MCWSLRYVWCFIKYKTHKNCTIFLSRFNCWSVRYIENIYQYYTMSLKNPQRFCFSCSTKTSPIVIYYPECKLSIHRDLHHWFSIETFTSNFNILKWRKNFSGFPLTIIWKNSWFLLLPSSDLIWNSMYL